MEAKQDLFKCALQQTDQLGGVASRTLFDLFGPNSQNLIGSNDCLHYTEP